MCFCLILEIFLQTTSHGSTQVLHILSNGVVMKFVDPTPNSLDSLDVFCFAKINIKFIRMIIIAWIL